MKKIEEHYRTLAPQLTSYFVGNGSSYADACEIVQETFLRLWRLRDTLKGDDADVRGLVFTIARNVRNDRARHGRFETFIEPPAEGEEERLAPSQIVQPAPLPGDVAYLRKRLLQALAHLPPVLRECFTLFQIAEMSVRDVAAQTGVSENLVKVRVHRAKQKLRAALGDLMTA